MVFYISGYQWQRPVISSAENSLALHFRSRRIISEPVLCHQHVVILKYLGFLYFLSLQIKATHYNDTGIADRTVHLFKGPTWSAELLQNLTTDSDGVAQFSLNTTTFTGDFELIVS